MGSWEGKIGGGKREMCMKWEENWSSGRKVEREGKEEEARKMDRKKKRGRVGLTEERKGGRVRKELVSEK